MVAGAQETGLLSHLEETMEVLTHDLAPGADIEPAGAQQTSGLVAQESGETNDEANLAHQERPISKRTPLLAATPKRRRSQLLTLLLLSAYGLRRPRDLRSYSGDALGLLAGRKLAYGYWSLERVLLALASRDGALRFTRTLGGWTDELWPQEPGDDRYVDGHRKPVHSQQLLPRSLIGRTGKILGCRGLMLLHDRHGHPLLILTGRGDWHVMEGLEEIVGFYEQITGQQSHTRIVVDREGMGAAFLKRLKDQGQFVVTLLRSNQYEGLASFWQVGTFVPLSYDSHARMTREVAPARFALALPEEATERLEVQVALIRDLRPDKEEVTDPCEQESSATTPSSAEPRLIPIITTDPGPLDAAHLALTYIHRWAAQENVIKDYLLPLGLDTNHGFAKTPVVNSEVAKRRETYQHHLETFGKWMSSAQAKHQGAVKRQEKLLERIERYEQQYDLLSTQQYNLDKNIINYDKQYNKIQKKKDTLSIQQEKRKIRVPKLSQHIIDLQEKIQRHEQKQRDLVQSLDHLEKHERTMYELDNRKDQVMTVFKVALANLAMWTRDQYFPDTYATATWDRLAPFFRLPGIIRSNRQTVDVELRPFNDRQYNRDLHLLCQRVNQKQPHLPDGRLLTFSVASRSRPILDLQQHRIA